MFRLADPQFFSVHQVYVSDIRFFQTIRFSQTFRTFVKLLMSNALEIETPELTSGWRRVSIDNVDIYVPQNIPIKVPSRILDRSRVETS